MSTGTTATALTHKEVQTRGLDILAGGLEPLVTQRMTAAAHGKDWVSLYEAKETHRLGRPFHANSNDPRLLLRILRYERAVFTEIHATQRAWLEELIQSSNRAAHSTAVTAASADRALDTMMLLADSLDMSGIAEKLSSLRSSSPSGVMKYPEDSLTQDSAAKVAPAASSSSSHESSNGAGAAQATLAAPHPDSSKPSQSNQDHEICPAIPVPTQTTPPKGTQRLSARVGDLDVVVLYREAVNYALVHNAVSLIVNVSVTNHGEAPVEGMLLDIELLTPPGHNVSVGRPLAIPLSRIDPFQRVEVPFQQLAWRLNPELFVLLDEAVPTDIQLTVRTTMDQTPDAVRDHGQVRLLTAEEWWALSVPELLAAFVRPNDPAVAELLADASKRLGRDTGSPSLEGYQSGPERVHQIAEAIYEAMADRHITYVQPPASFEGTGQRIRTHNQVLNEQRATCLDLACTYAAALEQAGLHPVLVLTEGHAFTGYLTEEAELPTLAVTQRGAITTIADSDMFDAVETTAVCEGPQRITFDQARGQVRRWWRADLGKVDYLLDVRASHRLVRPMPSIRMENGTRVVEVISEQPSAPARSLPASTTRHTPTQEGEALPARVDRWQRALLDMTYRNPLLKLKQASSTVVHVPSSMLATLEDQLADRQTIELVAHDDLAQIHQAQGHRTAADVDADALGRLMREEHRLFVALTAREYPRRLKDLQRKARTSLDETGTDNLYLALGTLHWTDRSNEGRAPIFLLPVRLTGGRGGSRFILSIDETRSLQPNYCLVEKLRTEWGLEIPALTDPGEDDSGIDVKNSLAAIRSALLNAHRQSFHVEETAHLALLQFATLDMWRDLRVGWEKFMRRPVVKHLVETPGQPFVEAIEPPAADASAEATSYLPIPADGSQIEAVRWAAAGKTFILEGPPGTGKSQTITNLIANCLAEGQKVLFVAEKQAALNVVKQRLDDVGLGVLSLDVHGKNQTVGSVREQLTHALKTTGGGSSSWNTLRARYREIVESLSRYPAQLHEEGPVDISAWSARQIILELSEDADLRPEEEPRQPTEVEVPRAVVMGGVNLDEVYDGSRDLANALLDLGEAPGSSPWRLAGPLNPETLDRAGVAAALRRVQAADAYLTNSTVRAGLALTNTPAEFAAIANWLDAVQAGVGRTTAQARELVTPAWNTHADQASVAVATFRSAQAARLGDFRPAALEVDLDAFITRSMEIDGRLFAKKKKRLALLHQLRHVLRHEPTFPLKELTNQLKGLATLRGEVEALVQYVAVLPGLSLPYRWNVLDEEHPYSLDAEIWGVRSAAYLSRTFSTQRPASDNDTHATDGTTIPARVGAIDQMTAELLSNPDLADLPGGEPVRELSTAWQDFCRLLDTTEADYTTWLDGRSRAEATAHSQHHWAADASGGGFIKLYRWLRVRHALARLEALGLQTVGEPVLAGELHGAEVDRAIRLGVARAILDERFDSTGLAGFDDRERQRWVDRFLATGEDLRKRMASELAPQIVNKRTFDPAARTGMVADLRRQLGRRRGGLSVRQIMDRFGSLIPEITPCFLMSPASVARFLPVDAVEFDVVVFDEASQIRVPQAIGAMGRGRSVVIVGDSKQMPPSSMFAPSGLDDGEDETPTDDALPVPVDLESILSEGAESSLPRRLLSWHYRSRDEALIAFSNNHYYEGGLSTFPAPPGHASQPAIKLQRVDGIWEGGSRGAARINRAEADAIVSEIRHLLVQDEQRSIGVVTFNTQQRDHILNLLDEARSDDALIDGAFAREDDALFVKNLENVQGDERDVVLFSLAFARDKNGTVPLNWGPLSRKGGERRFNVAVTRAKEQVQVFCSFDPHELDLSRSKSRGLADLKDYLLAARDGIESSDSRRAPIRDQHREDIASALQDAGLEVLERVGLSDFTVDIAARHSAAHPWIGVLLDGPTWAARESVGDREGLPTTILTGQMGWTAIERVWLPTWVRDRTAVTDHLVEVAARAVERDDPESAERGPNSVPIDYDEPDNPEHLRTPLADDLKQESLNSMPTAAQGAGRPIPPGTERERSVPDGVATSVGRRAPDDIAPVRSQAATAEAEGVPMNSSLWSPPPFTAAATDARYESWMLDDMTRRSRSAVRSEILDVIQVEGPILADRLTRVVAARFDLSRVRRSRRDQLLALTPRDRRTPARNGDAVYWPEGVDPAEFDIFRVPTDGETRDIDEIPYEELRNAMCHAVRRSHGMSRPDALKATMRTFNVQRLGSNVRERLEDVLDAAITEGLLEEKNGLVREVP